MADEQPHADAEGTAEEDQPVEATPLAPAAVHNTAELVVYGQGKTELIVASSPADRVAVASEIATALNGVILATGGRTKVGRMKKVKADGTEEWVDKYHINVESWQTLATLLGVALVERYVRPVIDPATGNVIVRKFTFSETRKGKGDKPDVTTTYDVEGHDWEACVDAVKDGVVIATGSGMVSRSENAWKSRDEFALRGMAATRATSRAMRQAGAWIVSLAGYATTPSEEMPSTGEPETEIPAWAEGATQEAVDKTRRALLYLLGSDGESGKAITAVLEQIAKDSEQGEATIPKIAARALLHTAVAARTLRGDAPPAADPPATEARQGDIPLDQAEAANVGKTPEEPVDGPPSGSVDPPDVSAITDPAKKVAALRQAGCNCENPLAETEQGRSSSCPLKGHGVPF